MTENNGTTRKMTEPKKEKMRRFLYLVLALLIGGGALAASLLLLLPAGETEAKTLSLVHASAPYEVWLTRGGEEPRRLSNVIRVETRGKGCCFLRMNTERKEQTLYYTDGVTDLIVDRETYEEDVILPPGGFELVEYRANPDYLVFQNITLSGDGGTLLFCKQQNGKKTLFLYRAGTGRVIEVASGEIEFALSPTGKDVLYSIREGNITYLHLLHGEKDRLIAEGEEEYYPAGVSSNGKYLYAVTVRYDERYMWSLYTVYCFSPDGKATILSEDACSLCFNSDLSEAQYGGPSGTYLCKNGKPGTLLSDLFLYPAVKDGDKPQMFTSLQHFGCFNEKTLYGRLNYSGSLTGESTKYYNAFCLTRKDAPALALFSDSVSVFRFSEDRKTVWFIEDGTLYRIRTDDPEKREALAPVPEGMVESVTLLSDGKRDRVYLYGNVAEKKTDGKINYRISLFCCDGKTLSRIGREEREVGNAVLSEGFLYVFEHDKLRKNGWLFSVGDEVGQVHTAADPKSIRIETDGEGRVYCITENAACRLENGEFPSSVMQP